MSEVLKRRFSAERDGSYVVFLTGMRFNKIWKFWQWYPVFIAMGSMIRNLYKDPSQGLLSHHVWFGRTVIVLQYWESYEKLEKWANKRGEAHKSNWTRFHKVVANSGDVGIWHETYIIDPGKYEAIYHNMPLFGLAKVAKIHDPVGKRQYATDRVNVVAAEQREGELID